MNIKINETERKHSNIYPGLPITIPRTHQNKGKGFWAREKKFSDVDKASINHEIIQFFVMYVTF